MDHLRYSPQTRAARFSMEFPHLIPRVPPKSPQCPRSVKVPSKASPVSFARSRMEMTGLCTQNPHFLPTHFSLFPPLVFLSLSLPPQSHFRQTVTEVNPMFGYVAPQRAVELLAQPMWECAPPSPPPSLSTACGPPRNRKFTFCFS